MGKEYGLRVMLALMLNCAAFAMAMFAVTTSYWCAGTRKVVKPFCKGTDKVKQAYCIHFNSTDVNNTHAVQYIYETGEEKFLMRKFHTGIWFSCEQAVDLTGFTCRNFLEIAPDHERGVLWLCIVGECVYIFLLFTGVTLMTVEMCHCCNKLTRLKVNAFAALLTALAGLFGMIAHMMFTTAFQLAVIMGPEDWKPKTWDYSWSYHLAWASFATCMASAVTALNYYTKTMIQIKFKQRNLKNSLNHLGMDMHVDLRDMYLDFDCESADENMHFPVNSSNPLCSLAPHIKEQDSEGEEYC